MERARARFEATLERAAAAGRDLSSVADSIANAAVERRESEVVASMIEAKLLSDLADLRRRCEAARVATENAPEASGTGWPSLGRAEGVSPDDPFTPFLNVPAALLDWFGRQFGLEPFYEAGEELEVPRNRLGGFILSEERTLDSPLVRIRIASPGWKRRGRVVVRPSAELAH